MPPQVLQDLHSSVFVQTRPLAVAFPVFALDTGGNVSLCLARLPNSIRCFSKPWLHNCPTGRVTGSGKAHPKSVDKMQDALLQLFLV